MNLDLGEYEVTRDKHQFTLSIKKTVQAEGKNKGKEVSHVLGYYPSIKGLIDGAIKHGLTLGHIDTLSKVELAMETTAVKLMDAFSRIESNPS